MKALGKNVARVILALVLVPLLAIAAPAAMAQESVKQAVCKPTVVPCAKPAVPKKTSKKPGKAAPAPASAVTPPASATPGCVEIHFHTESDDTAVRFPILALAAGSVDDIAGHGCTAVKRAGNEDFTPWVNEFCPQAPAWVCDFSATENASGRKKIVMGSYRTKPGEHILRLPAYFADEAKGYVVALSLIRGGEDSYPPEVVGSGFKPGYEYGSYRRNWLVKHSTDAFGVRWFDYNLATKIAQLYFFPKWGTSPASN